MDFAILQAIQQCSVSARVPVPSDQVFKDECMFSFDTPLSKGGLYISLNTWQGFGKEYVSLDHTRTGNRLYLHEVWKKVRQALTSTWYILILLLSPSWTHQEFAIMHRSR